MRRFPVIAEVEHRPPIKGRLRMGLQVETSSGKTRPASSDTWIVSAPLREPLETVAATYGGVVEPFDRMRSSDRWQVRTDAETVEVVLPADPLHEAYEFWSARGLQRRCDGAVCEGFPEDGPSRLVPCVCATKVEAAGPDYEVPDQDLCRPRCRLSVVLPNVGLGVWQLTTGGWNAFRELRASVDLIRGVSAAGAFQRATLTIEKRHALGKDFVVPVLATSATFDELTGVAALPAGGMIDDDVAVIGELVEGDDQWT